MSTQPASTPVTTPLHLWIVGVLSLVWNGLGAFDYLMTQFQVEAYMAQFSQEQLDYFYGFPAWADAAWALAVWGSVAGSVGLLVRKSWATWAFAISLVGFLGATIYTMVLTDGFAMMGGTGGLIFTVAILIVTVGLFLYARAMTARGVLR